MTIANIHKPIMVEEILSFIKGGNSLNILDCTFGGGGHTKSFLEKNFTVVSIDKDNNAKEIANEFKKKYKKLSFYQINFKDIEIVFDQDPDLKFDFILLDLGFSSNQLANDNIGISFQINSKLNMNYLDSDLNAYQIINHYNEESLSKIFFEYGEIFQSKKLANFIIKNRSKKLIETNFELIEILRDSGVNFRSKKIHFATQAFQALRIECNQELNNLKIFLEKIHKFINNQGYLSILSFHSLEDRIIKNYFKDNKFSKKRLFHNDQNWGFEIITKKPIIASKEEIKNNPRSRSAKLRVGRFVN
ncbi:16S rRNA (cytosine(1402)-N(4))-methyltransferase RsmH [Alphaproteobacteria bacterium]|nr:16S rRNA (cytosine(1402)-N(4))-methyltransferase RsmH [Alphaproteobacteria bacterium]